MAKKEKIFYVCKTSEVLVSNNGNLYPNSDGIIEVEKGSKDENTCKSYNLLSLQELEEKYLKAKTKK